MLSKNRVSRAKSQSMSPKDPIRDLDIEPLYISAALGPSPRFQPTAAIRRCYKRAKSALRRNPKTAVAPAVFAAITPKAVVAPAVLSPVVVSRDGQSEASLPKADLPKASVSKADLPKAGWPANDRITTAVASDLEQCMESLMDVYDDMMSISDVPTGSESDIAGDTGLHLRESTKAALDDKSSFIVTLFFTVSWFDDVTERPAGWSMPRSWNNSSCKHRARTSRRLAKKELATIEEE